VSVGRRGRTTASFHIPNRSDSRRMRVLQVSWSEEKGQRHGRQRAACTSAASVSQCEGTSHKHMLVGSASGRGCDKNGGVLQNAMGGPHTTLPHLGTPLHLQLLGTQDGWRPCWIVMTGKVKERSWGQSWQAKHPMPMIAGCGARAPAQSKARAHLIVEAGLLCCERGPPIVQSSLFLL